MRRSASLKAPRRPLPTGCGRVTPQLFVSPLLNNCVCVRYCASVRYLSSKSTEQEERLFVQLQIMWRR